MDCTRENIVSLLPLGEWGVPTGGWGCIIVEGAIDTVCPRCLAESKSFSFSSPWDEMLCPRCRAESKLSSSFMLAEEDSVR